MNKVAIIIPDLILCDVKIPIRNGYEVLEAVKNNEKYSKIPFILLLLKVVKKKLAKE